jgi:hypothetical protein
MKFWIDDVRVPPNEDDVFWYWAKSVKDAINAIKSFEEQFEIELIDIDHDAGDYANDGGDYIKVLDWLAETGRNYPIRIHSMNVVGVENMRRIIRKNGWTEVF